MKKAFAAVCAGVILAAQTAFSLAAADASEIAPRGEIVSILEYSGFGEGIPDGLKFGQADWTAYCAARLSYTGEDGAAFAEEVRSGAEQLISGGGFVKPTDLQRAAILLSALDEDTDRLINAAVFYNPDFDRQGLNAWIWALIAIHCSGAAADENALNTRESVTSRILSEQLEDGGFSLFGSGADCDMTAAAIYALAPEADSSAEVSAAVDRAVDCLSGLQLEDGGFCSMGNDNCESTAQAIIAFAAVGTGEDDPRVSGAVRALGGYENADGGYCHIKGGKSGGLSTAQALTAYTALELLSRGERLFDRPPEGTNEARADSAEIAPETAESADILTEEAPLHSETGSGGLSGRTITVIISLSAGAGAAALIVFAAIRKNRACAVLGAIAVAAAGGVWLLDIRSPDEYYSESGGSGITVTVSADCRSVLDNMDKINESVNPAGVIPSDGVILAPIDVELDEGETAFGALSAAAREKRVRVDFTGASHTAYIVGIGQVCEFGFGETSGWLYLVNGELPDMSAGAYTLSDGDTVEFVYTSDLGNDLEER